MSALAPLDIEGPAAPPRKNGELVFAEPWESRAFGMTMALVEAGRLEYEDFRQELIRAIARAEAAGGEFSYYRCWLEALQVVLEGRGLVDGAVLAEREGEPACRPPGHDHDHSHTGGRIA